ncbi:MAG: methylmalonyl Co-A mutase-associated GTPase MeaB, partial [Solirubrobacterales bacterium]
TEAARGEGVPELAAELDAHRAYIEAEGMLSERRKRNLRSEVISICATPRRPERESRLEPDEEFEALRAEGVARRHDPASAATRVLEERSD